jgi:diaminopimelate epimerase
VSGRLPFVKMHGAGNDFVVLDGIAQALPADLESLCRRLADRHFGVGADQVLILRPARDESADFRMDIYNQSGEEVEMCGNGIRALFKFLRDRGYTRADEVAVETLGGLVRPRWVGRDRVRVDMGRPILEPAKIPTGLGSGAGPVLDAPLELPDGRTLRVSSVSMGNPHAVIEVDDVERAPLETVGPLVERHPAFPNRVNVEFVRVLDPRRIRQRTWERGVGETLACGSGACATAVTAMLRGVAERAVSVELPGGTLEIEWAGEGEPVFMTGPAAEVFTGELPLEEK